MPYHDTNPYAHSNPGFNVNSHPYSNADSDYYRNTNSYANAYAYGDGNTDRDGDSNSYTCFYTETFTDAEGASHSTAAPVSSAPLEAPPSANSPPSRRRIGTTPR